MIPCKIISIIRKHRCLYFSQWRPTIYFLNFLLPIAVIFLNKHSIVVNCLLSHDDNLLQPFVSDTLWSRRETCGQYFLVIKRLIILLSKRIKGVALWNRDTLVPHILHKVTSIGIGVIVIIRFRLDQVFLRVARAPLFFL